MEVDSGIVGAAWDFIAIAGAVAIGVEQTAAIAIQISLREGARSVVEDGVCIVVTGAGIGASDAVFSITNPIAIQVELTPAPADAEGIDLVAVAVAIPLWHVRAAALINVAGSVTNAAGIELADAGIDIIADAVLVGVRSTISTAVIEGIGLVSVAITVPCGDLRAATFVNVAWPVANAASVQRTDARVDIIADAILIDIGCAGTAAVAQGIELVSIAVAVAFRKGSASTFVDGTWTIADTASISGSNAVVDIVANAVVVEVFKAVTTTESKRVELISITITVARRDVVAAALVNLAWAIANPTGVDFPDTWVFVIADAVFVSVGCAVSTALTKGVFF